MSIYWVDTIQRFNKARDNSRGQLQASNVKNGRIKKLVPPSYGSEEFAVKFLEWLKGLLKNTFSSVLFMESYRGSLIYL